MTTTTTELNLEQMNDEGSDFEYPMYDTHEYGPYEGGDSDDEGDDKRDLYEKLLTEMGSKDKVLSELNNILAIHTKITMNQYLNDFKKELEDDIDDVEFRIDLRENPIPSHLRDELKEYCIERMIERKEDSPIALMFVEGEKGLKRIIIENIIDDIRTIRNIKKN